MISKQKLDKRMSEYALRWEYSTIYNKPSDSVTGRYTSFLGNTVWHRSQYSYKQELYYKR